MKKLLILLALMILIPLTGCMTKNALEAERSFYQAMVLMQTSRGVTPIVRLEVGDPSLPINLKSIEVFAPPKEGELRQYVQKDYVQPWLNIFGAAVPWLGAWGIVKAVGDVAGGGNTTYNQSVSGTGNTGQIRTMGDMSVGNISGTNTVGGLIDQTSTPTVVYQPPPVIVEVPVPAP